MKKHDEGYVLAFVLIVVAVLALISTAVSTVAVRNMETQQAAVKRMQAKYEAEGQLEIVLAELGKFEELTSTELLATPENAQKTVEEAIVSKCPVDEYGNKLVLLAENGNVWKSDNVSITADPLEFSYQFSLTSQTKNKDDVNMNGEVKTKTITTSVGCNLELKGKITAETSVDKVHYKIKEPKITCLSYETSTEEVIG